MYAMYIYYKFIVNSLLDIILIFFIKVAPISIVIRYKIIGLILLVVFIFK